MNVRLIGLLGLSLLAAAGPALAAPCDQLAALALKDAAVTSATLVGAGQFVPPDRAEGNAARSFKTLPAFCRVAATLKPSSDSDIKVEVWLPASGWNGKFQAVGNGGWAGVISYAAMADAVRAGYATASTDTGHVGSRGTFALGHPEKLIDFSWRSEHEMGVKAKQDSRLLRHGAPIVVLERLLDGRTSGPEDGADVPERLRRDYRWRSRQPNGDFALDRRRGSKRSRQLHSAEQVPGHPPGSSGRVRCQ